MAVLAKAKARTKKRESKLTDLQDLLRAVGSSAWQGPQTLLGLAAALKQTGKMPAMTYNKGKVGFRATLPEGELPRQSGQVLLGPKDIDPVSAAHEGIHAEQSERYGPAYLPLNLLGGYMSAARTGGDFDIDHPFEDEAYLRTEPAEGLAQRLQFKRAALK